jgi:hypothetical protein
MVDPTRRRDRRCELGDRGRNEPVEEADRDTIQVLHQLRLYG